MSLVKYKIKFYLAQKKRVLKENLPEDFHFNLPRKKFLATFLFFIFLITISIYGLNLRSRAEDIQGNINNYNYTYDGISVHVKAENIDSSNFDFRNTATAQAGDTVKFTLTVSNPTKKEVKSDVKFSLPEGFSCVEGAGGSTTENGEMLWRDYVAKPGEQQITFEAKLDQ